jgi:hypothetical protein
VSRGLQAENLTISGTGRLGTRYLHTIDVNTEEREGNLVDGGIQHAQEDETFLLA